METYAEIQETLQELGEVLTFSSFTMLGVKEIDRVYLQRENAFNHIETMEFAFLISTQDYFTHSIAIGNTFTTTDGIKKYTHNVDRTHMATGDGWSRLPVTLTTVAAL